MSSDDEKKEGSHAVTLPGVVQKVFKPIGSSEPEKAEIAIEGADHLYREIRIENTVENGDGEKMRLKKGAEVSVTIEAPVDGVEKKPESPSDETRKKTA